MARRSTWQQVRAECVIRREGADGRHEYLDTTDPDTWTTDRVSALTSSDMRWLSRLAELREGAEVVAKY